MLEQTNLRALLIIDIETIPQNSNFDDLNDLSKELWISKRGKNKEEGVDDAEFYFKNAGILAEFGKIICISTGIFTQNGTDWNFRIKSFYGDDEKILLQEISQLIDIQHKKWNDFGICGHNINEFDIPYICRRMLINDLPLPNYLANMAAKKPWEIKNVDTMQLWKFGDYKSYISLKLMTNILNIPSPKDDIDGSQVATVYFNETDGLERIRQYCQKDIIAVAQILLKFKNRPLLLPEQISYAN